MKRTTLLITLGLSLLAVALVGLIMTTRVVASPAAPTFTVNSVFDSPADLSDHNYSVCRTAAVNTTCTLRAAIMKANRYAGGGVTINIPSGTYTLTLAPSGEDDETTGDLNITQTMTIVGAGAAKSAVDGGSVDRVFRIQSGATVTLTAITIRHGLEQYGFPVSSPLFVGGGIYNEGLLTLNSTVITENLGYAAGGGITNFGTLTVTNSVIAGNGLTAGGSNAGGLLNYGTATLNNTGVTANYALFDGGIANGGTLVLNNVTVSANTSGGGGAIRNQAGSLTMNNSTISGNNSSGGIYNESTLVLNDVTISANTNTYYGGGGITNVSPGTLTMNNSTISANSTTGSGGAIANSGTTRLFHVTIAGNLADRDAVGGNRTGGGISNTLGIVEVWNTIVAENYHGNVANDCAGAPITSQDYNYIQTTAGCSIGGTTTHNISGTDALLGPLQNNGGATETRALWIGSPALDQIPAAQCRDSYGTAPQPDQRGVARPINILCDIGAIEGAQLTPLFNRNLIRNGNAENSAGSTAGAFVGTANWTQALGQFTAVPYNAPGGFPVLTDTIPLDHGYNFFAGGNVASSFGTQMVTVTAISAAIDTGRVNYALSGDFGGYAAQEDYARLTLFFVDGIGGLISSAQIGDVTAAQRGNATGLLHRSANGIVPIGTRTISLRASMYRIGASGYNDSYADNLSLILTSPSVFLPLVLR